jgi:copper chaperone CopZ
VVTAVALAFVFFPSYVGALLGGRQEAGFGPDLDQVVASVEGMTCKGCAATLEKELQNVPGVRAVKVSYEKKEALLGVPRGAQPPREEIQKVIAAAGFKGQFHNLPEETKPSADE